MAEPGDEVLPDDSLTHLERLFHQCLALSAGDRVVFLNTACGGDLGLRQEVEGLLVADSLRTQVASAIGRIAEEALCPGSHWIGKLVGAYRIEREIGHGGMGTVYLASRADDQFKKKVAVKVLRWGLMSPLLAERFRQERQILASLEHPNIARLLDGGVIADGLPYLVMEYVEGEPLLHWCDRCHLSIRERLKLFQQLCAAVQYAHQRLVVHCDLKPDNILVDGSGKPKLLDFGVAKTFGEQLEDGTLTQYRPMTPRYASPEQVAGRPVSTATDVYGLGAILYELLAGIQAHALTDTGPEEMLRVICTEDPLRPSARLRHANAANPEAAGAIASRRGAAAEKLVRDLSGDLDAIVMKALRKEPSARYSSAEHLASDIERYIERRPVLARRHTLRYRAGRFIRRNKASVAASAVLLVGLLVFGMVAEFQAVRIARERDTANRIAEFLVTVFSYSAPDIARGNNVTAREILDRAGDRIGRELANEPEVQARMMEIIGDLYRDLGLYDRALPLTQSALRIRRDVLHLSAADLAGSKVFLARTLWERGNSADAEKLFHEVVAMRDPLLRRDPGLFASALDGLGSSYQARGNAAAAEPLQREALEIRRRTRAPSADIAVTLNNLGMSLLDLKRYPEAESRLNEALGIYRQSAGEVQQGVAACLNNLAILHRRTGDLAGAVACYREALAVRLKLHGESNPSVALVMANLGSALSDQGKLEEAEALARRSLEIRRKLLPEGHLHIGHSEALLGRVLLDRGDARQAEPLLQDAVRTFARTLPQGQDLRTDAEVTLGRCLVRLGRTAEAVPLLSRGCPLVARQRGAADHRTTLCIKALQEANRRSARIEPGT